MNRILFFSFTLLLFISCGGESKDEKQTTQDFLQALMDGNCGDAKDMCTGDAVDQVKDIQKEGCDDLKFDLTTISCTALESHATCECEQRKSGNMAKIYLVKKEDTWKVEELDGQFTKSNPEDVVRAFAQLLADGDCTEVLKVATGNAKESVQGSIDAGCEKYDTEIKSVTCDVEGDRATCTCEESRTGMDMVFNYDLKLEDGQWMVENYQKDLGMDMDLGGEMPD